jgi:hypothetical protein
MEQVIQVLGSLLILIAFAAAQRGAIGQTSKSYLVLNVVGSTILALLAALETQPGFLLLETCWALVSGWSLIKVLRRAQATRTLRTSNQ